MKNLILLVLLLISAFAKGQHGTSSHQKMEVDPWAISVSVTPEQTKLFSSAGKIMGFTTGAQLGYFFNENMWLTTGFFYSRKGFKKDSFTVSSPTNPYKVEMRLNYFEIPLYFSYRTGNFNRVVHKHVVTSHKKAGFILAAGPVAGILWDADYTSQNGGHQIDKTDLKNAGYKNTIGVMGSLGGYYQFSPDLFITLQPSYKITLSKVPKGSSYHWTSIGLQLNIWYRLMSNHPL